MFEKPQARTPAYSIQVNGVAITSLVNKRLKQLTITDNRGFEADTVEITLDDSDGMVEIPPKGAKLRVAIGWSDTGTVDKGSYVVDEVEHSGAPDVLTIRARSADLRAGLTEKREQSWHDTTVGGVVSAIALRNDLQPALSATLEPIAVTHFDQTNESDANMLTRLAELHGAIAAVKNDHLLFMPAGLGLTASGKPLTAATIERKSGDRHRFAVQDREAYTAVRANYFDVSHGKRGVVMVNGETAKLLKEQRTAKQAAANKTSKALVRDEALPATSHTANDPTFNDAGNVLTLRHTYATKDNAFRGAKAAWERLQRGVANFGITLAEGVADLLPEQPAKVVGFKRQIDAIDWTITKVTHALDDGGGYTTQVELETKLVEQPD